LLEARWLLVRHATRPSTIATTHRLTLLFGAGAGQVSGGIDEHTPTAQVINAESTAVITHSSILRLAIARRRCSR
jgi:hypothetical protein